MGQHAGEWQWRHPDADLDTLVLREFCRQVPARSNSLAQTYTFTFTDTNGWQDISVVNVLANSAINGIGACYVALVPSGAGAGSLFLVDDKGDAGGPYSGMVLPGSGSVSNSQCTISGTGSSVSGSGNTLTLTLAITFTQSFAGNQVFFQASATATTRIPTGRRWGQ